MLSTLLVDNLGENMAKKKYSGKYKGVFGKLGAFALPKALMNLDDFRSLPPSALKVLIVLGHQYNGYNNGDLSASHNTLKEWGGMAESTLSKSLKILQDKNLIVKTRTNYKGKAGARCALYALTWNAINDCKDKNLELEPTTKPIRHLIL